MEEVKHEGEKGAEHCNERCVNMHRFCGRHFCLIRVVVAALLIGGAFAIGVCVGSQANDGWNDRYDYERGYGRMMMWNVEGYPGYDTYEYRTGPGMMGGGNRLYRQNIVAPTQTAPAPTLPPAAPTPDTGL